MRKRATVLIASLAIAGGASLASSSPAAADTSVPGTYNAVAAKRILDTRSGLGTAKAALGAKKTLTFQAVTPLGATAASAVALNLTAVAPTRNGYLTAYSGAARPSTSALNFQAGANFANTAVVAVDKSGTVSIYNGSTGTLNLAVDATGYWTAGEIDSSTAGALTTVTPTRLYDTRVEGGTALAAGEDRTVSVDGVAGLPKSGLSAVVLNAAAANPVAKGYLSVTQQAESAGSVTSSVNFPAGASRSDLVVVAVDENGAISVHNGSAQPVDVALDVTGYISDGAPDADGSMIVSTAYRAFDDRVDGTPIAANGTRAYSLVPASDGGTSLIKSAVVTVTVATSVQSGYVIALNADGSTPAVSSLNHPAGQAVGQAMIVPVRADGTILLHNASRGATNLVVDVSGFVLNQLSDGSSIAAHKIASTLAQARHDAAVRLNR